MRIAVIADGGVMNWCYRAMPLAALRARGHDVQFRTSAEDAQSKPPEDCDVAFFYRYGEQWTQRLARRLRDAGVAVVWDNDDDLTDAPAGIGVSKGALRSQRARAQMVQMVRAADVVTTTSGVLAEQYRAIGAERLHVVENYVPASFDAERRAHDGVVIGWIAAHEHRFDLEQLRVRETLQRLLDARPDVRVVGVCLDLGLASERYRHLPLVDYSELPAHLAQLDVGIAPLADHPFNRARSNVKLKEYAALGVAWLASPVGPYRGLGERQGGRLVPDERWDVELERLVRSARDRRKLAKHGRKWASTQRLEQHLDAWERPLTEAAAHARARR